MGEGSVQAGEGTVERDDTVAGRRDRFGEDAEASVEPVGCGGPRGHLEGDNPLAGLRTTGLRQELGTEMRAISEVMGN